jgi:Peptidase family C25
VRRTAGALVLLAALLAAQESRPERRFLIVAPEKLAGELKEFVAFKSRSFPTDLLTLEAALRESKGVDDPEKLKRTVHRRWKETGVAWVLLVGDADVMPVRYMVLDRVTPAAFDYAFYPSDLYYADLVDKSGGFEDWNAAREGFHKGYFGEVRGEKNKKDPINYDAIDYRPEIAVGRWPTSTPAEVAIVARKSMRRDEAVARGEPWIPRIGAFVVGGWIDARGTMDAVTRGLGPYWGKEKRYYADPGSRPTTPPPVEAEVVRLLNEGCGLVVHAGHGNDDRWDGCFSVASFAKLANAEKPAVMMSCGCSTARFATLPPYEAYVDTAGAEHAGTNAGQKFTAPPPPPAPYQRGKHNPTGLGERLLRDGATGAAAYIGCNTGSQPCGLTLLEGFAKAVASSRHPRVGDCWKDAMRHYFDAQKLATLVPDDGWYPPSIFFQGMKFMLFGDPTLRIS